MGLVVGAGGGGSDGVLYEYIWDLNSGPQSQLGGSWNNVQWIATVGPQIGTPAPPGGLPTIQIQQAGAGGLVVVATSGAGISINQVCQSNVPGVFGVPLARNQAIVSRLGPRYEYLFEIFARVGAARGTADVSVGFMKGSIQAGQGGVGIFWSSRTGANGGRWTPRSKRTNGAADFANGNDSGVANDQTPHKLSIAFLDLPVPVVNFAIDDVTRFAMSPPNLPTLIADLTGPFIPTIEIGNPVGTDMWLTPMRWRVRQIG